MQLLMTLPNLIRYNLPDLNNIHLTFHWISFKGNLTQFFRAYWNKIKLTWNVSRATSYDLTYLLDILSSWLFIGSHWYAISRSFTGRFGTKNRRWVETRGPFPRNGRFFSQNSPICRISTSVFRHSRFSRCAAARSNSFFCFLLSTKKAGFLFFFNNSKKKRRRGDKLNPQSNRFSSSGNDKLCLVSQKNGEKTKRATDSVPRSKTKRQKKKQFQLKKKWRNRWRRIQRSE